MTPTGGPRSSLSRYLFLRVVPLAAVVNFVLNALAAAVLYPAGKAVPLTGPGSITADTGAAAFAIGFLTLLTVAPGARREALSGRIDGFGFQWLAWSRRHPILCAIALGLLLSAGLGTPVLSTLHHGGVAALPHGQFIAFKAAFAGLSGVVAAVIAVLLAVAAEDAVGVDPRWCETPDAPVGGPIYPLDLYDKGGLSYTDNARGCSSTPTWQLVVEGALDPTHLRIALADVYARYPVLTAKIQSLDGIPPWAIHYRYAHDSTFRIDDVFRVVDVRAGPGALDEVIREELNRPLDLFRDYPMTVTQAITGDQTCRLFFRQHHAVADGRAFIALLTDFAAFLDAARAGRRPPAEALAPIGRRSEVEALDLSPARRRNETLAGYGVVIRRAMRARLRPTVPLLQNRSNDYSGGNGTVHWVLPDSVLDDWNATRKQLGVSLNSLLTGALFLATQRWHQSMKLPVGRTNASLVMETRPRDGSFISFANHLAVIDVELRLGEIPDLAAAARAVQARMDVEKRERTAVKRLLCERQLVSVLPLVDMQRVVFESKRPVSNLDFSNLISLAFPTLGGAGWRVEDVLITTTITPRTGILLTVIRYNGKIVFNFNYKESAATREQTVAFAKVFEGVMVE